MNLHSVIVGPIVTEKAERQKTQGTYIIQVRPEATKIDLKNALRKFYDVEVTSVRVMRTTPKFRLIGQGSAMQKRPRTKRMIVTLGKKSKALDLSTFRTA